MAKKENKIMVERETFEKNGKSYYSYFIKGNIRGKEVRVLITPPDKGGYTVLDIVFGNENSAELVVNPMKSKMKQVEMFLKATLMLFVPLMKMAKFTNATLSHLEVQTNRFSICL